MSIVEELRRRNVFRVGIAYALMGWVLLQGADFVLDVIGAPDWVIRSLIVVVAIGLPITLFFAWAFEVTPEGIKREAEVDRSQSITPQTGRKLDRAIISFLAIAVVLLLTERFWVGGGEKMSDPGPEEVAVIEPQDESAGADPAPAVPEKSIVVLPFVNMSSDAEQEFFSDGISEEILNALAQVPDLKVAGRTSSFAFKGRNEDLRTIGEALGVNHILEGSVRKAGNRVRITAQLIKADDGFHLWSDTYDRELTDVFAIQDEIAGAILDELETHLVGNRRIAVDEVDLAVYDQFLLARQKMRERNEASLLEAARLLDEVITADPDYAPAWAHRGVTELLLSSAVGTYGSIPPLEAVDSGRNFLNRALEIDPDQPYARAGLGLAHVNSLEYDEAIEDLESALALRPNDIDTLNWLQQVYDNNGELRKSLSMSREIHSRDPLYLPTIGNLAFNLVTFGRIEEANAMVDKVIGYFDGPALNYVSSVQVLLAERGNQTAQAIRMAEALEGHDRNWAGFAAAFAWLNLGEPARALAYVEGLPPKIWMLGRLGRFEEAVQVAQPFLAAGAGVTEYFYLLMEHERYHQLIEFFEARWGNAEGFLQQHAGEGFGMDELGALAMAYRQTGMDQKFDDTLAAMRRSLDRQFEQGANNWNIYLSESFYRVLAGDVKGALTAMKAAVDRGYMEGPDLIQWWAAFRPLTAEPDFQVLMDRMLTRRNEQRALLGLPPWEADA